VKVVRVIAAWLAALSVLAGLGLQGATAAHADTGSEEAQFLDLTNQLRSSLGLHTLAPNAELINIARSWSSQMAAAGAISHNPSFPNQVTAKWTRLGENVGTGGAVGVIQTAFINSPHHYENLVQPDYNYVGIGVVDGPNGAIYVTVDFMTLPGGSVSAPAPRVTAPKAAAPRATTPAAPRVTTARPASPSPTSPPVTTPPVPVPVPVAAQPASVKGSPAFGQVLAQLRALDVSH
jgi:uncharacterized protein YkwD